MPNMNLSKSSNIFDFTTETQRNIQSKLICGIVFQAQYGLTRRLSVAKYL
jgi:hypothetical protein